MRHRNPHNSKRATTSIVRTLIIIMNKIKQCKIIYRFHYLVWIARRAMGWLLLDTLIPPMPARNKLGISIYERDFIKYNNTCFAKLRGCLFTWYKEVRGWRRWLGSIWNNDQTMYFGGHYYQEYLLYTLGIN